MCKRWSRYLVPLVAAPLIGTALVPLGAQAGAGGDGDEPWLEQAKLTASDGAGFDQLGIAVAIEGDTALVAANAPFTDTGMVYVFTRSEGAWGQQATLTASDAEPLDQFGVSVALSGDIALVGANAASVDGNSAQGAAYVFTRRNGEWSEQAKLTASDGQAQDNFGFSAALSGESALVGAPRAGVDGSSAQGAAYVFTRSDGTWDEQAKLTASDGAAGDELGGSAALSGDTALVGAAGVGPQAGAAWVFTRNGEIWSEQSKLVASDGGEGRFGTSVAVEGDNAVVGAPGGFPAEAPGAAYVFTRSDGTWDERAKLTASDGMIGDRLGTSVALLGDRALLGANQANAGDGDGQGAAYVFTGGGDVWTEQAKLTASDGMTGDHFGRWVDLSGDSAVVGAFAAVVDGNENQGAAYVFVRDAGAPEITVDPDELASEQGPGERMPQELTVGNAGDADLDWSVLESLPSGRHASMPAPGTTDVDTPACEVPGDAAWVDVDPLSGTVAPGGEQLVDVVFDSTGLTDGDVREANLCLESNDPASPLVVVPVTLTVVADGGPDPIECDETISGVHLGPLTVLEGTTCLAAGAFVLGEVNVRGGAELVSTAAVVQGSVSAGGATVVDLSVTQVTGPVLVSGATHRVWLFGNQVTGSVSLVGNRTDSPTVVAGNTVIGSLTCFENQPDPTDHGLANTAVTGKLGQCAEL